jgi:hypothetical protein
MIVNQVEAACIHLPLIAVAHLSSLPLQQSLKKFLRTMNLRILSNISLHRLNFWLAKQASFTPTLAHLWPLLLPWRQAIRGKVEL